MEIREMNAVAIDTFQLLKNLTNEQYKLIKTIQEEREKLEELYAVLKAQAARSELGILKSELLGALLISKLRIVHLQNILAFELLFSQ